MYYAICSSKKQNKQQIIDNENVANTITHQHDTMAKCCKGPRTPHSRDGVQFLQFPDILLATGAQNCIFHMRYYYWFIQGQNYIPLSGVHTSLVNFFLNLYTLLYWFHPWWREQGLAPETCWPVLKQFLSDVYWIKIILDFDTTVWRFQYLHTSTSVTVQSGVKKHLGLWEPLAQPSNI